jgi:hypothetical protein
LILANFPPLSASQVQTSGGVYTSDSVMIDPY